MAFEGFRRSFDELLTRATRPEERRVVASRMKETLVQARMGLDDLRGGLDKARERLTAEERELETTRRRKQLAEGINDRETVDIAAKYEQMHAERVDVLKQRVAAQEAELALAERDVAAMSSELKAVLSGVDPRAHEAVADTTGESDASDGGASDLRDEINSMSRARERADREADAARRLDELKRRMGK
jgi:chromosome segregation ATPase